MFERWLAIDTLQRSVKIVVLRFRDDGQIEIETARELNLLDSKDHSDVAVHLHNLIVNLIRDSNYQQVLVKGSEYQTPLIVAELKGITLAASKLVNATTKKILFSLVGRIYGIRNSNKYINDEAHWEALELKHLPKGYRHLAMMLLLEYQSQQKEKRK